MIYWYRYCDNHMSNVNIQYEDNENVLIHKKIEVNKI